MVLTDKTNALATVTPRRTPGGKKGGRRQSNVKDNIVVAGEATPVLQTQHESDEARTTVPSRKNEGKRSATSDSLRKPFKSPLKSPRIEPPTNTATATTPLIKQTAPTLPKILPQEMALNLTTPNAIPRLAAPRRQGSSSRSPFRSPLTGNTKQSTHQDHEMTAQMQTNNELRRRIKLVKCEIELLERAVTYERPKVVQEDAVTARLVPKWRTVAQKAAEHVFCIYRDRIDRLPGGFEEWKQSFVQRSVWDEETNEAPSEEVLGGGEEEDVDADVLARKRAFDALDCFTMKFMLQMSGVPEKLIGWNESILNFDK